MSFQLSIYSNKAFKNYLLPAINNANHTIYLSGDFFSHLGELEINLEVVETSWHFLNSDKYEILNAKEGTVYRGALLRDGELFSFQFQNGSMLSVLVTETTQSFYVFSKYDISGMERITIGRNEKNDITFAGSNLVKREKHAVLSRKELFWVVENYSENGVFVNSAAINGSKQLEFGDCINIFGLCIVFLGNWIAVNDNSDIVTVHGLKPEDNLSLHQQKPVFEDGSRKKQFHRSPRQIYKLDSEPIEIEAPPQPGTKNKKPLFMTIGPSLTMAIPMLLGCGLSILSSRAGSGNHSAFMYTGLVTAVSSALIGTIWAVTNIRYEKRHQREEELHRFEAYGEYLIKCSNEIKEKYERNAEHLRKMYPDAAVCCTCKEDAAWMWNRNGSHLDFLSYRLGIGDIPFQAEIIVPKERFTMINDSLADRPRMIKQSFQVLHDVPVCVDLLEHTLVGIVGGASKTGARDVVYNLAVQAAVANCYTDVKMIFIYDEAEEENGGFRFAKWLPHVWSEDKKTRFVAGSKNEASDVLYELTKVLRIRMENNSFDRNKEIPKPYYLLFVASPELLEGEIITSYIYKNNAQYGLSTIMMVENYEELPNACDYVIENDKAFQGMFHVTDNMEERISIQFDHVSGKQMEWFARNLSNIEVNESEIGGEIPMSLSFFEMYGINRLDELKVIDRWRKNRTYDSMKALIGQKSGGMDCYLDIHEKYHGPHGLVAGTTGSGKSETLQTYILSLALNFSPDDVGFFLIDYKGGGMANLFDGLPHILGQISNLSGNQVRRAMVSIKSENKRRQQIFNEHGVNNINLYTKLYKNNEAVIPVPHMFIVIDEFAELKREEPEFMKELISVAQVGRSLGVHLILATQKPSGTVDDNIWSNSKFRLCLRVQDRQDSNDMLHRPDAAYITQAGRCYMQVGNDELFELFQSGFSGASYDEENSGIKTNIAFMVSTTGKAALVGNHMKLKQKEAARKKWILRFLKIIDSVIGDRTKDMEAVLLSESESSGELSAIFAKLQDMEIDYPENEYSRQRVRNLLEAYIGVLKTDVFTADEKENGADDRMDKTAGRNQSLEKLAEKVLRYAEEKRIKLPERKEKTQLDAVVEYLHEIAEENHYAHQLKLWLPVLPTELYLQSLDGFLPDFNGKEWENRSADWHIEVPVGLYDDPVNQAQEPFYVNFSENGHHVITGMAGSGKSTFLQTLLYALVNKYTPAEINLYILDYSAKLLSSFKEMPHVGGIVYENENDRLSKFFSLLQGIIAERKKLFTGVDYKKYVRSKGIVLPAVFIVIDNYAGFRGRASEEYDDIMMQLVKEGVSLGIFLILTSGGFGSLEIPNRIADNIRTTISLEMSDKFQYSEVMRMTHLEVLPEINVKGRGLAKVEERILEYQTALAFCAEDDFKRMDEIETLAKQMREAWTGVKAKAIPEIPQKPVWEEFAELDEVQKMLKDDRHLPVGYNAKNASVYGIDLSGIYCYIITGRARTGRTNFLKTAALAAGMRDSTQVSLIDFENNLSNFTEKHGFELIDSDEKLFQFLKNMLPDFKVRNVKKKENMKKGLSDEEVYTNMCSFPAKFIFIANLADFITHVSKPAEGIGTMKEFVANILDKGTLHNVFWFACHTQEDSGRVVGNKIYECFIRDKEGIHFGGNVSAQRIMNFDSVPYMEQNKTLNPGIGMLPANEEGVERIVVPLMTSR